MSKDSLRETISTLQKQSQGVLNSKELSAEVRLLITSMMSVLQIIVSVLLEKKTRKNSSNSGLPPSRNDGPNGNRNKKRIQDRDKLGSELENTRHASEEIILTPHECSKCGEDLSLVDSVEKETRKKIDIIYEVTTTIVTSEVKECPHCGEQNKGLFPKDMAGPIQYGTGIRAMIINFSVVQMMSFSRIQEYLKGLVGNFISQAIMLKYIAQLSQSLENWEKQQIEKLLKYPAIHCDETSIKVNKINYWIHSYSFGEITLQFLHEKRGIEAMEEIGIIPRYGGTLIHDCWASYLSYDHVEHGLCGSHLLRELKFIEDSTGQKWATKMKKLLQEAAETVGERSKRRILTDREYKRLQSRYRNILTRALQELPPFPEKTGLKGRRKHTDSQNLWLRLSEYEQFVLFFSRNKFVDFTNNRSERDLRSSKVKQKVAGCFRSAEFAKHFCRITSYLKSMRYSGYSAFEAICLALQGNIPL